MWWRWLALVQSCSCWHLRGSEMSVLGFVADPFEGWSDPYGTATGFKFFERGALHRGARQQIEKAKRKVPLKSYRAEATDNRFISGPTNNIGAFYRLAYWYAVASRIANTNGKIQASRILLTDAESNLAKASKAANTGVDSTGREKQILEQGARNLKGAGFDAIAAIVSQQSTRVEFAKDIRKQTGVEKAVPDFVSKTAQLKLLDGTRPWWFWPVVGGAGLIALAIILRPYAAIASAKGK